MTRFALAIGIILSALVALTIGNAMLKAADDFARVGPAADAVGSVKAFHSTVASSGSPQRAE